MEEQTKKKILLIDDDASLLLTLSDFLKFEGYDVMTADSGEQGLRKLARMRPDLIILDMSMPGMGGMGFLKEISSPEGKPRYSVLVLTARANMAEFFANVAVDGFIAKPCDPNDLLMEVGRIIFLRSSGQKTDDATEDPASSLERKKILIGEDNPQACEKLTEALRRAGFLVDSVAKGPEILEKAIVQRPDAIVLKLVLSSMNGDLVASMLREMPNTREIPIVIYSDGGGHAPDSKLLLKAGGVTKFVTEDHPAAVLAAVAEVLK